MDEAAIARLPFAYYQLGGGGGGGGGGDRRPVSIPTRVMDDRATLEQVLGSALLDRLNGYPVKSLSGHFKELGGTNKTVINVLDRAFGDDFDAVANLGRDEVRKKVASAIASSLAEEGLTFPTTKEFRDIGFHISTDPRGLRVAMKSLLQRSSEADEN